MTELKDYGVQYFHPQRVQIDPPLKEGWQTTKDGGGGITREQINQGLNHKSDVKALIEKGYGEDDFAQMSMSDDPDKKAISDSYRMFWGERPIDVDRQGDDYIVGKDGRHRLDVAQARGEREVPMRVHAPADDPEFSGRKYDAASFPQSEREEQEKNRMGRESMRGDEHGQEQQHNPVETRESHGSNPEKKPQLDDTPEQRENLHKAQGHGDDMKAEEVAPSSSDAMTGQNTSQEAKQQGDPMDGSSDRTGHTEGRNDTMDGAEGSSKKANLDRNDLSDATGDLA